MKELVLIDGNSLLNRAFYATKLLSTKDGTPTNAVFGFVKLLLKIIDDSAPDRLIEDAPSMLISISASPP